MCTELRSLVGCITQWCIEMFQAASVRSANAVNTLSCSTITSSFKVQGVCWGGLIRYLEGHLIGCHKILILHICNEPLLGQFHTFRVSKGPISDLLSLSPSWWICYSNAEFPQASLKRDESIESELDNKPKVVDFGRDIVRVNVCGQEHYLQ